MENLRYELIIRTENFNQAQSPTNFILHRGTPIHNSTSKCIWNKI
jgi:hypothetical protein